MRTTVFCKIIFSGRAARRSGVGRTLIGLLLGYLVAMPPIPGRAQNAGPSTPFEGRALLVLSDTDMKASAYIDGKLGGEAGADMLSVIPLGGPPAGKPVAAVPVSNSVIGPPQSVAVTPDGKLAIAIETRGPRPRNRPDATMKDLGSGHDITVIDLSDLARPRIVQRIRSFERPQSVSIDRTGTLVAVAYGLPPAEGHPPLVLFPIVGQRLSAPVIPRIPDFGPEDTLVSAQFHPRTDVIGLVYGARPRLALLRYDAADLARGLSTWGNAVTLDRRPFLVRFTPDGRFAIVNDIYYGDDIADADGTLLSIAIDQSRRPGGTPVHRIVSHLQADYGPEGLTISPDGRWVVTTNLEHSPDPAGAKTQSYFSSISLYQLAPGSGQLTKVGVFAFDGVLPESAEFDNASRQLAVANFDCFECSPGAGSIDFWRLSSDATPPGRTLLVRTNHSVRLPRGAQSMAIVR